MAMGVLAGTVPGRYNRTEFVDQRRAMLQAWADYLDQLRLGGALVLPGNIRTVFACIGLFVRILIVRNMRLCNSASNSYGAISSPCYRFRTLGIGFT